MSAAPATTEGLSLQLRALKLPSFHAQHEEMAGRAEREGGRQRGSRAEDRGEGKRQPGQTSRDDSCTQAPGPL